MRFLASLRAALVALALVVSTVAFASAAHAGTLRVEDDAKDLTSQNIQQIQKVLGDAPFDGRLVVTTQYEDAKDLSRYVGSLVTSPDLVVVGLDPEHRHVQVHFGTGSNIPRTEWPAIERAGNDEFRKADWAGGAAAIFQAAAQSTSGAVAPQTGRHEVEPAPVVGHSFFGIALTMFVLIAVAAIAIGFFSRRRSYGGGYNQAPYGGPGYGGGPGYPPGYGPPGGGMGPVGGGLIGAGLGGLAGYELGKAEGEREERDHDRGDWDRDRGDSGGRDNGNDGNYDAGGGGSSWDDSGGGNDGGGFDGGGGGNDGGGGSDF